MTEKGFIQFTCRCVKGVAPTYAHVNPLNYWRTRCRAEGLVGVDGNGIGYGNLSIRIAGTNGFVITGTQTGALQKLGREHFSKVVDFDLDRNRVVAVGPIAASSESLSHAALYAASRKINAVIHVHHPELWRRYRNVWPTTEPWAEAGTPEMGYAVRRLAESCTGGATNVVVMAGHEDGLIAYGTSLDRPGEALLSAIHNLGRVR